MRKKSFVAGLLASMLAITFGAQGALAVRTTQTAVSPKSLNSGTIGANAADVSFTAVNVSDGNGCIIEPGMSLLVTNTHADTEYDFTVASVADKLGRTGNIVYPLQAGEFALFGPITLEGWRQSNGQIYFGGENAAIKVLVIKSRTALE